MGTFVTDYFYRFVTFIWLWLLLDVIFVVCCTGVEFVTVRERYICILRPLMRIWNFFRVMSVISGATIEWLIIRVVLIVFNERMLFCNFLRTKLIFILCRWIKRNKPILILNPRYYFFPHLWLMPRVILTIFRIDVIIRFIIWSF